MSAAQATRVVSAMLAVQRQLAEEGIKKDRVNSFDKSKFRGIDDVYNVLSSALVKANLSVTPTAITRHRDERTNAEKKVTTVTVVEVEYTFTSAEDGSERKVMMHAEAFDTSDKSTGKAMSYAYKQMAFQVFCIPIEGHSLDPDDDKPELPPRKPAPPREPTKPAAAAPKPPAATKPQTQPDARYEKYWPLFKNSSHVGQTVADLQDEDLANYIARLEKARDSDAKDEHGKLRYRDDAIKYLEVATRVMKSRMPPDDFRGAESSN